MTTPALSAGRVHSKVPKDLGAILSKEKKTAETWESLTPLARNEWLCWVESASLNETRDRRVKRVKEDLAKGKRRPCCWIGCIHRTDKAISPSVKAILEKRQKKS